MEVEHSFGVIPYRAVEGGYEFFVIRHVLGHITFPKGHVEEGESPSETALRELHEETGITDIVLNSEKLFESEYDLTKNGTVIHKKVGYFLGEISGDPSLHLQTSEVKSASWLSFSGAVEAITFPEDRKNLTNAMAYLEHQSK